MRRDARPESPDGSQFLFLGYQLPLLGIVSDAAAAEESHRSISFELADSKTNAVHGEFSARTGPDILLGNKRVNIAQVFPAQQWIERETHQANAKVLARFRRSSSGIRLEKWEYDFLKMQYSIPREIRVAVVSDGKNFNLFPIDLFGFAGDEYMILSLRHAMNSCTQLESTGKMATWIMNADAAGAVYEMGHYHGAPFRPAGELPVSGETSPVFGFPQPLNAICAEEFELVQRIAPDYGHHRLFVLKRTGPKAGIHENSLAHIHRAYAEWLLKQGFPLKQITR